jgi:putative transposase
MKASQFSDEQIVQILH